MNMDVAYGIVAVALALAALGTALYWGAVALMTRVSPKYAQKRQLRAEKRVANRHEADQASNELREAWLRSWAAEHPEDRLAQENVAELDRKRQRDDYVPEEGPYARYLWVEDPEVTELRRYLM